MKGERNIFWNVLAFTLAIHWTNACLADSTLAEPAKTDADGGGISDASKWSPSKFFDDWKLPETVQIHGFASQSYLWSSGNEFFGHTTNAGSMDFTEMGINGSWRPLSQLQTSMQIVYRRAGKTDDSQVRIDFGFLDYSFLSDADKVFGIRLGRVVNPYGLYNDTRDMPFTRPSILLPQSIYFDVNRNVALSGDGAQIYGEHRNRFGDFFLQANGFYSRMDDPDLVKIVAAPFQGSMQSQPSWLVRLMYEWDSGRVRLGITSANLAGKYEPRGPGLNYRGGNLDFSPIVFSAQYNAEKWNLTSEYAIRPLSFQGFGPLRPDTNTTGESYYVQGSYRFTESWEGFLRYDVLYWNTSDRNGKKTSALYGGAIPAYQRFAKDLTTGLRWNITPSIMARIEYHYINGTGWLSNLENTGKTSQYWSLVGASLSFRF